MNMNEWQDYSEGDLLEEIAELQGDISDIIKELLKREDAKEGKSKVPVWEACPALKKIDG